MTHNHPADRQAWRREYYRLHGELIRQQAKEWYETHKNDKAYREYRKLYMRAYRLKKKYGL